jgi:hypothetical protein
MNRSPVKKWTIVLMIVSMMFSTFSFVSAADSAKSDVKGHWAEGQLNEWLDKGLIKGFADGTVKPNNPVTRAELTALINRAFGYTEKAEIHFSDMTPGNWAYDEAAIAIKAGYIKGKSASTFGSDNQSSRQEVAVIIGRLLHLQGDEATANSYVDASSFAPWSKAAIGAVSFKKILQGYGDRTFRPQAPITRAELVVTLDRALKLIALQDPTETQVAKNTYSAAGTYGPVSGTETVSGDVVVNVPGVTLQNMVINGNLLLAEGIGSGDAFLKNVTVKGTTNVHGGGDHSIHFENSVFATIVVDKKGGTVRIVLEGSTTLEQGTIKSPVILELGQDSKTGTLIIDALLKAIGQGVIGKVIINDGGKGTAFEKQPLKLEGSGVPVSSHNDGNSNQPTASITVTNAALITDISVDNGVSLLAVLGQLPTTVQITLSDLTTPTVNVTWNGGTPAYKGSTAGTYVFTGALELPNGVTNPQSIHAVANVIVAAGLITPIQSKTVTNVLSVFTDVYVANGTSLLTALSGLPTTVQITLSDLTTPTVNLSWDGGSPDYNGSIAETYVFTGTPELPMTISNPNDVKATVKVIVAAAPPAQSFLDAALAAINLDVAAAISSGLPATFPLQNLVDAGVSNTNSNLLSYYRDQLILASMAKYNTDLLLTEVQDAINKINIDATLVPAAAAIIPVNHFNNQAPGNNNLESADLIILAFNVKLKAGAVSAIQAVVDATFGSGNATVITGNNITFNITVNVNKNISLPQQGALITLAVNTVQNYFDWTIDNTAPIDFTIIDTLNV